MCCASIFTCVMAMSSNFPVIYTFRELLPHKYKILLHLDVILVLLLLTVTFFSFQNQLYFFFACSLKELQNFSCNIFHGIKYVCFLRDQMPKLLTLNIHKEYAHLSLLLKNFLDCLHILLFF